MPKQNSQSPQPSLPELGEHKPIPPTAEGARQAAAELSILSDYLKQFTGIGSAEAVEVVRALNQWASEVAKALPK